jgi:hypothetical protein
MIPIKLPTRQGISVAEAQELFVVTIMVGLWGTWKVLKGTIMFSAPKSEPGDVAEQ